MFVLYAQVFASPSSATGKLDIYTPGKLTRGSTYSLYWSEAGGLRNRTSFVTMPVLSTIFIFVYRFATMENASDSDNERGLRRIVRSVRDAWNRYRQVDPEKEPLLQEENMCLRHIIMTYIEYIRSRRNRDR